MYYRQVGCARASTFSKLRARQLGCGAGQPTDPPTRPPAKRIALKERLLAATFGDAHAAHSRAVPWALVPGVM